MTPNLNACALLVTDKKAEIAKLDEVSKEQDAALRDLLMGLPNIMYDDVAVGKTEDDNVELHTWGGPKNFAFDRWNITNCPQPLVLILKRRPNCQARVFVLLRGAMARLNRGAGAVHAGFPHRKPRADRNQLSGSGAATAR